jgi:hypothetical protein
MEWTPRQNGVAQARVVEDNAVPVFGSKQYFIIENVLD